MALETLADLFVDELKDLYSAEKQLVKALPKMAKAASSAKLRKGFEDHLRQTEDHVERLENIFEQMGVKPRGPKCEAMEGLIEEGKRVMKEDAEPAVMDAALIAAAQRVEHYEIAGYGTVRTFARMLGNNEAERLLQRTLEEESQTNEKLTKLAESEINAAALQGA
ncbi:MAG TPA: ferritin-like domain-containing protein [Pirellulales bacterium]|nr:ferritin-like domain-containing protein [Pirellulales bacterium]